MTLFTRVQVEVREGKPVGIQLLTLIAAVFYAVGWVVGGIVRLGLFLAGWAIAAVRVGFIDGRSKGTS